MFVNMWWIQAFARSMSCCPAPSVCFSLTFQSQAQPLSSLTPPGYLQPPFLSSIPHSSLHTATNGTVPERERGRKKECKNSRERQEGRSSHALSYFLNDGDQSRGAGRREEGQIQVCEGREGAGSQLSWPPDSPSPLVTSPLASLMGVLLEDMSDPSRLQPLKQPWQLSSPCTSKPATPILSWKCAEMWLGEIAGMKNVLKPPERNQNIGIRDLLPISVREEENWYMLHQWFKLDGIQEKMMCFAFYNWRMRC